MVQYITTLKEAKKKDTTKAAENSEPSVMPSARSQSTTNGSKPKPRINNQKSRNWPASKSSCVTTKTVPIAEHSRNSRSFSDSKHFVCSKSPEMWNQWVKIFKIVGLRWVPTGKIFTSSTTKVDSEPTNGSNDDITNQYECKQTLDVSAGTLNIHAGTSLNPTKEGLRVCSELGIHDHSNELSSSKLVPKGSFSRQDSYIMTRVRITIPPSHNNAEKTYALSWNPGQGDLLNLPDTGYIKMEMVMPHSSEELEYGYLPSWAMRIIFGSDSWLLVLSYEMDGYRVVVGLVLAMRWRAANFEIKHGLLTLVQNKSSSGHDKEDHMPTSVTSIKSPPTLRYPNVPTTSISCCFFFSLYEGQPGYGLKKNPSDQFRTWMTSSAKVIIQFFSTFKRQNLRNEITNFKLRFGKFDGGGYVSDFEVGSDSKIFSEHVQFQGCSELSN
ncbi:hypothetical protein Tco_0802801 [Tanacetum coccineum]|uniref:Uncharacterized protein n=1 Tax=Tanacetum coccineum TaxID=301880 RepID=A0ABQ4ZZZ5_9ASTR